MGSNIRKAQKKKRQQHGQANAAGKKVISDPSEVVNTRTPKTARGRRMLKKRQPQAVEPAKTALIIKGHKASQDITNLLHDLHNMKKPLAKSYSRKHSADQCMEAFDKPDYLINLCNNQDSTLFALGSTTKKRPARLLIGRLFDEQLLDMQEFKVSNYKKATDFPKDMTPMVLGAKPMIIFQGSTWEESEEMKGARSLLLDFFRGATPEKVALAHLSQLMVFSVMEGGNGSQTANERLITCRSYKVMFDGAKEIKKTDEERKEKRDAVNILQTKVPNVSLRELGPRFDLKLDRTKQYDKEVMKAALKQPKGVKKKNVKTTKMGQSIGKVHLGKQDLDKIYSVHGEVGGKAKKDEVEKGGDKAEE